MLQSHAIFSKVFRILFSSEGPESSTWAIAVTSNKNVQLRLHGTQKQCSYSLPVEPDVHSPRSREEIVLSFGSRQEPLISIYTRYDFNNGLRPRQNVFIYVNYSLVYIMHFVSMVKYYFLLN